MDRSWHCHVPGTIQMSVVKRGNSPYWYIQFQLNGKTYIRSSKTISKKAAEVLEAEMKSKVYSEQYLGQRQRVTFRQALLQFCDSKQGTTNYPNLKSSCRVICRLLPVHRNFDEITSHDLERYKRDRIAEGISHQTIKHGFNLIRGAWKYAKKLGFSVSPLEFPELKVSKVSLRYLNDEEERRLLTVLDPQREEQGLPSLESRNDEMKRNMQDVYDLVVLLLDTGARYSEIANIEWNRIDLDQRMIYLWRSKVQNETILYMTDRVYEILLRRQMVRSGSYVFQNRKGGARGYASQSIRKGLRKAGLHDCRIHTLRHTHASRLIQNGMSVYEVREILGHTDIKTTMRYAHLESRHVTSKARDVINWLNRRADIGS
jgi:integrase